MENLEKQISQIVADESEKAFDELPKIHSFHEGCAFLQGSLEETDSDLKILWAKMRILWEKTKTNCPRHDLDYELSMVKNFAITLAAEAIKTAVICDKFSEIEIDWGVERVKVKVVGVADKREDHVTAGHGAVGQEGEAIFRVDNRLIIPDCGNGHSLITSPIEKITVETRNSVYELEVVKE